MSLVRQMPADEINFGDTFDSRYFMREGWERRGLGCLDYRPPCCSMHWICIAASRSPARVGSTVSDKDTSPYRGSRFCRAAAGSAMDLQSRQRCGRQTAVARGFDSTNKPLHHTYNFLCDRRANVSICRGDIR